MNSICKNIRLTIFTLLAVTLLTGQASAAEHKMVIQVNTDELIVQKMALLNAGNLKKHFGSDNADVEIVIYGPGLSMIKLDSVFSKRIAALQSNGVNFSVCEGTLKTIKEKTGSEPKLLAGMKRVKTGALRIIELQEKNWSYMRP